MFRPKYVFSGTRLWIIFAFATLLGVLTRADALPRVQVAWDPNPESNIAGYRIYWGPIGGAETNSTDVGFATTGAITDLDFETTYFFFVTAYNFFGLESDPSAVLEYTTPQPRSPRIMSPPLATEVDLGAEFYHLVVAEGSSHMSFTAFGLPPGISVLQDGTIGGVPTAPGTFSGVISVANGILPNDTQSFTITVREAIVAPSPDPPVITSDVPPSIAVVGRDYEHVVLATGSGPITFRAEGLPPGLAIAPTGTISGVPTTEGVFTGYVSATNDAESDAEQSFSITVLGEPAPISLIVETNLIAISPVEFQLPARIEGTLSSKATIDWHQIAGWRVTLENASTIAPIVRLEVPSQYRFKVEVRSGEQVEVGEINVRLIEAAPDPDQNSPLQLEPPQFFFDGTMLFWDSRENAVYHIGLKRDLSLPYWFLIQSDIQSFGSDYTYWVDDSTELLGSGFYTIFEERN